jgi:hypothetical protein
MKSSPSISQSLKPIILVLRQFQFIIFFIALAAALAYCVLTLSSILNAASNTNGYTSDLTVTTFDQSTINALNNLKTSTDPTINTSLPPGRINPFTE